MAGIFSGLLAILVVTPFFYLVGSHVPIPFGQLIALFPMTIGIYSIISGCMTLSGKSPFGEDVEVTDADRSSSAANRLDEIERLKRTGLISADEYAAKRQDILKDL